jgi:CHASE2 domain-containing sensor protein
MIGIEVVDAGAAKPRRQKEERASMPEVAAPRILISYSHDDPAHCDRVLALADRLRADGIDAVIDQYVQTPSEGWPAWCAAQIDTADFVLMVCTETYLRRVSRKEEPGVGHGVLWEGRLINQYLYDAGSVSAKFIPVLLANGLDTFVPLPIKGVTIFRLETPEGYESLLRLLSDQPLTPMPPLGTRRLLPPRERRSGPADREPSNLAASLVRPPVEDALIVRQTASSVPVGPFPKGGTRAERFPWRRPRATDRPGARAKALIGACITSVIIILVRFAGGLQPLELAVYDKLLAAWAGDTQSTRITLVGANEEDIKRLGHWPLSDGDLADLLERLASFQPRVIGVDLYRDIPKSPGSEQLTQVLKGHPEILWCFKLKGERTPSVAAPEPLRSSERERAAFADVTVDRDNVVRRGLLYAEEGVETYTGLGLALALRYLDREGIRPEPASDDASDDRMRLGKTIIRRLEGARGPYAVLDDQGYQVLLDYRGGKAPFKKLSMNDVIVGNPDAVRAVVKGRAIIIGSNAESVPDVFTTPLNSEFTNISPIPGIQIHGYLADQLIREAYYGDPSLKVLSQYGPELIWIWGWTIAGTMFGIVLRRPIPALVVLLTCVGVLTVIVYLAFGAGLLLPAIPAGLACVCALVLGYRVSYAE